MTGRQQISGKKIYSEKYIISDTSIQKSSNRNEKAILSHSQ